MRHLRRLALPALFVLGLTACAPATGSAPSATGGQPGFPVTVKNCGREITVSKPPEKVVTGYQPVFETMVALGLGDRIVARTNFEENGPDGFLPGHQAVYDRVEEISPTIELPQKEVLLTRGADFVISAQYTDFDATSGRATLQELDQAGTPAFITAGWCDPAGVKAARIADIFTDLENLGKIFGVPEKAAALTAELKAVLADVERRTKGREPVAVLATDGGKGPVNAYGGSGLMHQMVELAGGKNVLADLDEDYAEVSVEVVAASQPQAMLVLDYATLRGEDKPSAAAKADTVFAVIKNSEAAKRRRYLPVPAAATHSGYRNILAIPTIAKFLHPQAFTQ